MTHLERLKLLIQQLESDQASPVILDSLRKALLEEQQKDKD